MFIEIKKDIIDNAIAGDELSLHVLQMAAIGIQKGKHWYFLPKLDYARLKNLLSPRDLKILSKGTDNDSKALSNRVEIKLVVTYENYGEIPDNIRLYNPRIDTKFELYEETHVICENLYDVDFYKIVMKYYVENHPNKNCIKRCKNRFLGRNGGGHTTAKVVKRELDNEEHLFVVILDRDSKCPGYRIGDTATDVADLFIASDNRFSSYYILQHHREAENLIPYPILKQKGGNELTRTMLDHCNMEWFDFKEGLKLSHLYGDNVYNHWSAEIDRIRSIRPDLMNFDISERDNYKSDGQSPKEYIENCKNAGNPTYLYGWGKNILSDATDIINGSHPYPPLRKDLTPLQHQEWQNIGNLLWHWTLSREGNI